MMGWIIIISENDVMSKGNIVKVTILCAYFIKKALSEETQANSITRSGSIRYCTMYKGLFIKKY